MSDIELVIKIPEEVKNRLWFGITYSEDIQVMLGALSNGTLLPKGHGRLIDADKTLSIAWTNFYKHEDEWEKKDDDYLPIGRLYDQNGFECCQQTIVNAPTIIEADKESEEE